MVTQSEPRIAVSGPTVPGSGGSEPGEQVYVGFAPGQDGAKIQRQSHRHGRITVELILEKLAAGESIEQLLESYPFVTEMQIRAALAFGAQVLRASAVFPTVSP